MASLIIASWSYPSFLTPPAFSIPFYWTISDLREKIIWAVLALTLKAEGWLWLAKSPRFTHLPVPFTTHQPPPIKRACKHTHTQRCILHHHHHNILFLLSPWDKQILPFLLCLTVWPLKENIPCLGGLWDKHSFSLRHRWLCHQSLLPSGAAELSIQMGYQWCYDMHFFFYKR